MEEPNEAREQSVCGKPPAVRKDLACSGKS